MYGRSIFEGVVLSRLADSGPEVFINQSSLSEDTVFSMAVQGMTVIGMGSNSYVKGVYGPIPVPNNPEYKSLIYTFSINAEETVDHRIAYNGRWYALFLVFHEEKTRDVIKGIGIINPYIEVLLAPIQTERDLTDEFLEQLAEKIMDILTKPRVRTIQVSPSGKLKEHFDDQIFTEQDNLIIIDEGTNEAYLILMGPSNPFLNREIINRLNRLNMETYRGKLKITQLREFMDIERVLNKYNIKTRSLGEL